MKSICQLMEKGWALSTSNLPLGGLPRNSVDRITDRPDMTSAVDCGRKALTQLNLNCSKILKQPKSMEISDITLKSQSFILLINVKMPRIYLLTIRRVNAIMF